MKKPTVITQTVHEPLFITGEVKLSLKHNHDNAWVVVEDILYLSECAQLLVFVPAGFETDLASVPRIPLVYSFAGGKANAAAIVHDALYQDRLTDRKTADDVFLEAMKLTGVGIVRRRFMYWAVRLFGKLPYDT